MKYFLRWGLAVPKEEFKKWKKDNPNKPNSAFVIGKMTVSEHGTIVREDLKKHVDANNTKKKDYSAGLQTKMRKMPRKIKVYKRYQEILKLNKLIMDKKASIFDVNRFKKLRMLEVGRYQAKKMRRE